MANPQLEEMQEMIADLINRVSFLENSLPGSAMTPMEEAQEVKEIPKKPWDNKQRDTINQIRGEVAYLNRRLSTREEKTTKKYKSKYKQYT